MEGKQTHDVAFVLEEESGELHIPAFDHNIAVVGHESLTGCGVATLAIERHHGQQLQLGSQLGKGIDKEVVPAGITDVEIGILVGKAH